MSPFTAFSQLERSASHHVRHHNYSVTYGDYNLTISKIAENIDVNVKFQFDKSTETMNIALKIIDFNKSNKGDTLFTAQSNNFTYHGYDSLVEIQGAFNYLEDLVMMNKSVRKTRCALLLSLIVLSISKNLVLESTV